MRRVPMGTVVQRRTVGVEPPKTSVPPLPGATEEIMVSIDLDELAAGREELNVPLQSGDVVYVARAGSYYVGGSVEKPGPFFLKGKTTIQQAVTAAGGPKDVADWADIRLYRVKPTGEREVLTFSLNEFEKGQAPPEVQKARRRRRRQVPGQGLLVRRLRLLQGRPRRQQTAYDRAGGAAEPRELPPPGGTSGRPRDAPPGNGALATAAPPVWAHPLPRTRRTSGTTGASWSATAGR